MLRSRARRAGRRFREARWLQMPRILRPTRAGWCFFVITLGVGFAALNTGNNLLYLVLSLMLAFLILSGVLSESALRGIRVRRRLPAEVFAGSDNSVWLEIENTQRRVASFAVVIEDRVRSTDPSNPRVAAGRVFALRIGAGECVSRRYHLCPGQRGLIFFEEFRVSTRFPFGLFMKFLTLPEEHRALAYPAIESVRSAPLWRGERGEDGSRWTRAGAGSEVSGLREFGAGDALRRVHWKSSLRRRALVVREIEDEESAALEVRLRTTGISHDPTSDRFEQSVRRAASEVVAHLESGLAVALRTDSEVIDPGAGLRQRARLLSFLALVEPDVSSAAAPAP